MTLFARYFSSIKNIFSLQLVMTLSIGLLFFIGIGESYRVAPSLTLNNVCNQAELLKDSIDTSLKLGLPIEFQGFESRATGLANQSEQILSAHILPAKAGVKKALTDTEHSRLTCNMTGKELLGVLKIDWNGLIWKQPDKTSYAIVLPLEDKIDVVGDLVVSTEPGLFNEQINQQFYFLVQLILILVLLIPLLITLAQALFKKYGSWILKGVYHCTFILVAGLIMNHQVVLYADQIKAQSYSLANSLSERLNIPISMGFDLDDDLIGFEDLLGSYRSKGADISHIFLLRDGSVRYQSISAAYQQDVFATSGYSSTCTAIEDKYSSSEFIATCLELGDSPYQVLVKTPWSKVYAKLWNASRNILVLFIASVLLSNLFLNVLQSIHQQLEDETPSSKVDPVSALELVRPIYALGVLMEAINLAFLPAYLSALFEGSGTSVSTAFGLYFVCFAAVLLPAGRWSETHSLKKMMWLALLCSSVGLAGLAFTQGTASILILRGLAGAGQGILFIAVQSYLLDIQHRKPEVSGAQQLVFGFNVSTISGAAIGGLLMPILGEQVVFLLGSIIGLTCVIYTLVMIQDLPLTGEETHEIKAALPEGRESLRSKIRKLLKDIELNKTILLVGFPTKALFAGVLVFIMPMLLREMALDTDLIGQILIFYYIGVLITTALVSYVKNSNTGSEKVLFVGAIGSGIGLLVIGAQNLLLSLPALADLSLDAKQNLQVINVLAGVFIVGLSHGCIHAPVISHVVKSEMAQKVGKATTAAYYRFLERLGHVAGPALAAYFLLDSQGMTRISQFLVLGGGVMVLGTIFIALNWQNLDVNPAVNKGE